VQAVLGLRLQARAAAGAGAAGAASAGGGRDTERSSSRVLASPRKCDRMVFAEACSCVTNDKV